MPANMASRPTSSEQADAMIAPQIAPALGNEKLRDDDTSTLRNDELEENSNTSSEDMGSYCSEDLYVGEK